MNKRDLIIALDHAHGKTFAAIAEERNLHTSRAAQIYYATMKRLGLPNNASAISIGLAVQRREEYARGSHAASRNTPASFYEDLRRERLADIDAMRYAS